MTMKEALQAVANKKAINVAQYKADGAGTMNRGINDKEAGYTVGCKTTRSRNSGFYKPTFANRIKL